MENMNPQNSLSQDDKLKQIESMMRQNVNLPYNPFCITEYKVDIYDLLKDDDRKRYEKFIFDANDKNNRIIVIEDKTYQINKSSVLRDTSTLLVVVKYAKYKIEKKEE